MNTTKTELPEDIRRRIKGVKMKECKQKAKSLGLDLIIENRLEYLRQEIENCTISTMEILELQDLSKFIDKHDVLLLEWAGVPEGCA